MNAHDSEARIAIQDRQAIGNQADTVPSYIVIPRGKYDIISFLTHPTYSIIYSDKGTVDKMIVFTKSVMLLQKTKEESSRSKLLRQLENTAKLTRDYVLLGFHLVVPSHIQHFMSLCFGWKSFEELTSDVICEVDYVCPNGDISKKRKVSVPKEPLPVSFVLRMAKYLRVSKHLMNQELIIRHGYHHLDTFISALHGFYKLSATPCNFVKFRETLFKSMEFLKLCSEYIAQNVIKR